MISEPFRLGVNANLCKTFDGMVSSTHEKQNMQSTGSNVVELEIVSSVFMNKSSVPHFFAGIDRTGNDLYEAGEEPGSLGFGSNGTLRVQTCIRRSF